MIDYELLKRLKNAGFLKKHKLFSEDNDLEGSRDFCTVCTKDEYEIAGGVMCIPTLSELIEACGNDFRNLFRDWHHGTWTASTHSETATGTTPEEAVINLYLALNPQ